MSSLPRVTVQALQSLSPWTAHQPPTSTRSPLRLSTESKLYKSLSRDIGPQLSHTHPEPPRWQRPGEGTKLRHIYDPAPFIMEDDGPSMFKPPPKEQMEWIAQHFNTTSVLYTTPYIVISTRTPPNPVPLTVGGKPAVFCLPGQWVKFLRGDPYYSKPRFPDPCPTIPSSRVFPTKTESLEILHALAPLMNIQAVIYSKSHILVELVYGDGREYGHNTLPGIVAGRITTYRHSPEPFIASTQNLARQRSQDPALYLPGPPIGPLPQDGTNYLSEPHFAKLCPGVQVSSGHWTETGEYTDVIASTTCGIHLRKGTQNYVTVANHGFLSSIDVYHPHCDADSVRIGQIVDRYPELDIAMVRLTPGHLPRFTNDPYFEAEAPKSLLKGGVGNDTWFEVDSMSTGLITLYHEGFHHRRPIRPPGSPEVSFDQWSFDRIFRVFGGVGPQLKDGMRGAPIVQVETGAVAGFFHMLEGDGWAISATLDDLIAEGYEVV